MDQVTTRIAGGGRIVIPAGYRKALGLRTGDEVIIRLEDGELRIMTIAEGIRRAQELARPFRPKDGLASEQLIAERRAEAARE